MRKIKINLIGDDERGWEWSAWTFHGAQCLAQSWRVFKTKRKCIASIRNFWRLMQGEVEILHPYDWKNQTQPPTTKVP